MVDKKKLDPNAKLSLGEKIGYALGDTSANIAWRPLMSFLPIFYTDVFGLPLAVVSSLLLITRLSDGVTDLLMGTIADRTNTKWGKFRPWLLWTALPFGLFLALTFTTPNFDLTGKIIWAYVTYITFTLLYTANNVPYSALMGVMTGDLSQRTQLSSFRFFGAYFGGVISMALIPPLVKFLGGGDENAGYQYTMYVLAVLMVIFTLITFASTRERIIPPKQTHKLKDDFKDLINNKPWLIILVIGFLFVTFNSIKQGIAMYYFTHYLHRELLGGAYLTSLVITSMVAALAATPLANKFGKKQLFIYVMIFTGIVTSLLYFAGPEDIVLIFTLGNLSEFAAAIMPVLFFSMLGDTADYSEYKNGRRATGLIFSAGSFSMKLGGGVAGAVMLFILGLFNYDGEAAIKSKEAIEGIILNMSVIPAVFIFVAAFLMLAYPLSKQKMIEIEEYLNEQREKREKLES
jgi:GPH family glycoside/pentoside/hexuronide:cation symporter